MINFNGENWELPQMKKDPEIYYSEEKIVKTMISGRRRTIFKGRRFAAVITYPYLLPDEADALESLLQSKYSTGYVVAQISTQKGTFSGNVNIWVDTAQKRFVFSNDLNDYIWTNWQIKVEAIDYD